ncbi:isotrichodermin C-15 hydroxylase (cytochrome P-450 monooxygenase CYP65A1) [Apiospora kogelbergensis]|uniref:isotrichodermin C-15 hydroxylase (cytochrome P-450 monooxygenase CYP65A1) n=1 Tax=Apiospora kogelbergensis TaxID=1337665 RepID=UPI00312D52A6
MMLYDQISGDWQGVLASLRSASTTAILLATVGLVLYWTIYPIYSLFLHPLHSIPGQKLSACTRIPYWIACIKGNQVRHMTKLHRVYGPVVRYGPNDLSYSDGRAWRDIHAVPKGKKENTKEVRYHGRPANGVYHIIAEPSQERHAVLRDVFAPAFSEQALRRQEPMFRKYADMLVGARPRGGRGRRRRRPDPAAELHHLRHHGRAGLRRAPGPAGQQPLLGVGRHHVQHAARPAHRAAHRLLRRDANPLRHARAPFVRRKRMDLFNHTASRVDKRLEKGASDKPDLWNLVVNSHALTRDDMHSNAIVFMMAGTETTASLLTGLIYYLIANPDKMKTLTKEIRETFPSSDAISFQELAKLKYLDACLREGQRVYPPLPSSVPREIAPGGNEILGRWIPEGTRVSVHHTATNPDKFAPERWQGDPDYADDKRDAHQPFSVGPRNCLGMNMAWHEMRLILAKLLYNFDIESDVGPEWREQDVYVIWDRKPLMCRLKEVNAAHVA